MPRSIFSSRREFERLVEYRDDLEEQRTGGRGVLTPENVARAKAIAHQLKTHYQTWQKIKQYQSQLQGKKTRRLAYVTDKVIESLGYVAYIDASGSTETARETIAAIKGLAMFANNVHHMWDDSIRGEAVPLLRAEITFEMIKEAYENLEADYAQVEGDINTLRETLGF